MQKPNLENLNDHLNLLPHYYANQMSNGRWIPYRHLVELSLFILPRICEGGARIIVTMPPRHGKSEFISRWLPLWYLENFPGEPVILASYEADFASSWGRKVRDEIEQNENVGISLNPACRAGWEFETNTGGTMRTAGVGGPITGKGAKLFVIDDPVKNWQDAMSETKRRHTVDWYDSVAHTRLEPGGSVILLMTRWHQSDLAGYLLDEHSDSWELFCLPALAEDNDPIGRKPGEALCPERYDETALGKIKKASNRVWVSLYQQRPVPDGGEIWRRDAWRYWDELPELDETIQSWDMTFKDGKDSDFVVGQIWGRKGLEFFLIDQVRGQWSFTKCISIFQQLTLRYPNARLKLIENKANGPAIENMMRKKVQGIKLVEPDGGKIARAIAVEPIIESGHVHLPNPAKNPWVKEFIDEATVFPKGKHDDMVDTSSQAISYLEKKTRTVQYRIS